MFCSQVLLETTTLDYIYILQLPDNLNQATGQVGVVSVTDVY